MTDIGNKAIMAENLRYYIQLSKKTQKEICKDLNFKEMTFSDWVNTKTYPRIDKIEKMAQYFGIEKSDLIEKRKRTASTTTSILIPVLGRIVAGEPIDAITDIIDYEEITPRMAQKGKHFALVFKGNSMEPTLREGDVVIVRQQSEVENGEIAIVLVNGNEATVKEVKEAPAGITLIGHNVAVYTPHFYTREQIESLPIAILGKVVELRRKF